MTPIKSALPLVKRLLVILTPVVIVTVCWRFRSQQTNPAEAPHSVPQADATLSLLFGNSAHKILSERAATWRMELAGLSKIAAVAWLNRKLDGGEDAPTGEGFVPNRNGRLKQSPTWRVAWLEELGQRDPAAAAAQAEKILATPTSPEEWAVALRWLALGNPQAHALLEEKTRALLHNEQWRAKPVAAWLEAFDVAVHLGGTSLLPDLAEVVCAQDNHPANHAAFLALDRLVQKDTALVLTALHANASLLITREAMRGNLFARADVSDAPQRQMIEEYLLAPGQTATELDAFADVFPNANYHISANLLTVSQPPNATVQRLHDANALATIRAWRQDNRFKKLDQLLARIEVRLQEFVATR